jgi:hypothetical protein
MAFLFSMPNIPGTISQTFSAAEFQQGVLGITFNMVVYRAPLLTPKPGVLPELVLKSLASASHRDQAASHAIVSVASFPFARLVCMNLWEEERLEGKS